MGFIEDNGFHGSERQWIEDSAKVVKVVEQEIVIC